MTKKRPHKNTLRWEIFDRGLCFDGPNLIVFELTGVFRQSQQKSMVHNLSLGLTIYRSYIYSNITSLETLSLRSSVTVINHAAVFNGGFLLYIAEPTMVASLEDHLRLGYGPLSVV